MEEIIQEEKVYVDAQTVKNFLEEEAEKHINFTAYHNIGIIKNTVASSALYLDKGKKWNDKIDRESFNSDDSEYVNFGKCFFCKKTESVAMWMLYGGIKKKGAMVNFGRALVKAAKNAERVELGYFDKDGFHEIRSLTKDDFTMQLTDIIYYEEEEDGNYKLSHDKGSFYIKKEEMDKLNRCKKSKPWDYEKECRLIISIKREYIDDRVTTVQIKLNEEAFDYAKSRIYHAPNFKGEMEYNKSTLYGKIDWDLCEGCSRPFVPKKLRIHKELIKRKSRE